jgi:hypothetical protein
MQELERLGVRVVSGRLGRKAGDEDDNPSSKKSSGKSTPAVCYLFYEKSLSSKFTSATLFLLQALQLPFPRLLCRAERIVWAWALRTWTT